MDTLMQICYDDYRLKTFDGSEFAACTKNCTPKKMADAGFYYAPSKQDSDRAICYACGIEAVGWDMTKDDPWKEHEKMQKDCMYLKLKKNYKNDITMAEFIEIEKYRFEVLIEKSYFQQKKAINEILSYALESFEEKIQQELTVKPKKKKSSRNSVKSRN